MTEPDLVCPIIEPVKAVKKIEGKDPLKTYRRLVEAGYPIGFIANPKHGDFLKTPRELLEPVLKDHLAQHENFIPTLLVDPVTPVHEITTFAKTWKQGVGVVHAGMTPESRKIAELLKGRVIFQVFRRGRTNEAYRDRLSEGVSVLLGDGFTKVERNKDYPDAEFFSDLIHSHTSYGYDGFGDFLIVGDHFSKSGGPALAVAIHLTNLIGNDLWVHHFLSDRTDGKGVDTPGKFLEALRKAARFIRSSKNHLKTQGCRDFLDLERRQHFPGLGQAKRISMKHHLELVGTVLRRA